MSAALPMIGHKLAQERFLAARQSGRLHHGWILQGPSGIGKSLFAKRLGALILGAKTVDAPVEDSVMQKVISGSHPDLKWVTRGLNDKGQLRQDIIVDQIRDLNRFFALRPALAGWRVGVIDALDETNISGLNALLKTLEEPPQNAILLLISHGTKPLLPTIRSRCQVLRLNALSDDETTQVLNSIGTNDKLVASLAHGRPGYGLALKESGGAAAAQAARTMLSSIRKPESGIFAQALKAAS
ncbi:MAG: DNA polymerase III subunit delta', partial [Henriciella sp.]|nr:DNA polymerase III subunit delta' [Henriciella sp.]